MKGTKFPANLIAFTEICLAMQLEPRTKLQLCDISGINYSVMCRWIILLHQKKLIYIHSWVNLTRRGKKTPLWAWGLNRVDAIKPPPKDAAALQREYIKRKKASRAANLVQIQTAGIFLAQVGAFK